jgi:hypothetical protein
MVTPPQGPAQLTVEDEIGNVSIGKPHVVLLGAGASAAALPNGDKYGRPVPLLRDVAVDLDLFRYFPEDLQELAHSDFEAAYSRLVDSEAETVAELDSAVHGYFSELELPDEPNLYDVLNLTLRDKDAIFTFNWDPFLMQSRLRLARLGVVPTFPRLFFLHGNVTAGWCREDETSGLVGRNCSKCGRPFEPSPLLFPVENKNYQDGGMIEREWAAVQALLKECFWFTIFGYSAPVTDVEAVELLKEGWGEVVTRDMEQTELIVRPGSDEEALRDKWDPFIHTHHYEVHEDFYESWLANHPRRSGEAFWNQYFEAAFISDNPIPQGIGALDELAAWFQPLFDAEAGAAKQRS